jgi:hypothetical protein
MTITIHQPNFVPWYPFFQKIQQADVFVLLGHCQFEKNGYQNRFNFNGSWNTLSVKKGLEPIRDKVYISAKQDWIKLKNKLPEYGGILSEMDDLIVDNLYQTNKAVIMHLMKKLDIKTQLVEDYPTSLKSTERLVDICKKYGATTYLAGQGGKDYLDESLFESCGIEVKYQEDLYKIHTLDFLKNETAKL